MFHFEGEPTKITKKSGTFKKNMPAAKDITPIKIKTPAAFENTHTPEMGEISVDAAEAATQEAKSAEMDKLLKAEEHHTASLKKLRSDLHLKPEEHADAIQPVEHQKNIKEKIKNETPEERKARKEKTAKFVKGFAENDEQPLSTVSDKLYKTVKEQIGQGAQERLTSKQEKEIEAKPDFAEKILAITKALHADKIQSVSYRMKIFRTIEKALNDIQRQENNEMGKSSTDEAWYKKIWKGISGEQAEYLNKLEASEKKYDSVKKELITFLNIADEESSGTSSGAKILRAGLPTGGETAEPAETKKDEKIKENMFLNELAERLMPDADQTTINEIADKDEPITEKINELLNVITEKISIASLSPQKREEIFAGFNNGIEKFSGINKIIAEARLKEELAANGPEFRQKIREIYDKYRTIQIGIMEKLHLARENKRTGEIIYNEGVNVKIED
jgi:hypothetical protein